MIRDDRDRDNPAGCCEDVRDGEHPTEHRVTELRPPDPADRDRDARAAGAEGFGGERRVGAIRCGDQSAAVTVHVGVAVAVTALVRPAVSARLRDSVRTCAAAVDRLLNSADSNYGFEGRE